MQVVSHLRFDSLHLPPVVIASPIWLIGNHFPQARRRRAAPPHNKTSSEEVLRTRWPAKLDLRCPLSASRFPRSNLPASSLHQPWDSSLRFSRFLRFLRRFFSPRGFLTLKRRTEKPQFPHCGNCPESCRRAKNASIEDAFFVCPVCPACPVYPECGRGERSEGSEAEGSGAKES